MSTDSGPASRKGSWTHSMIWMQTVSACRKPSCSRIRSNLTCPDTTSTGTALSKKGYSGTAIFSKKEPLSVTYGLGIEEHDQEGRLITADFGSHYLLCCYTPNSQRGLVRLDYRMKWETEMIAYMKRLSEEKPVILCGDLNVAHEEIDIANPASNHKNAGFTDEERSRMTELLSEGFTDSFRFKYPDKEKAYSWWSYFAKSRERNIGWRIDYFIVSNALKAHIEDAKIHPEIMGSDHCPVELDLD